MTTTATAPHVAEDLATAALTVARRFANGATMWCVSPRWPEHGRHLAVEFVHPVIIGKRALPAIHVEATDLLPALRLVVRPGDLVVAVGPADDGPVRNVLQRAEPGGVTTAWLGAGPRPPAGSADHILWVDDVAADLATRSGDVVLLYHLLWELTHVVFEHPGLLQESPTCDADADAYCVTCSDEGNVAEVMHVLTDSSAEVRLAGTPTMVDVTLVDPVRPGDLVLVHAGIAITLVAEA